MSEPIEPYHKILILEKQLEIAVEALKNISNVDRCPNSCETVAQNAIDEMEAVR